MKRKAFLLWTRGIVIMALALVAFHYATPGGLDSEVVGGLLGAAAGALAIAFQRRGEFITTLRTEWESCLHAIAEVRALYVKDDVQNKDFITAFSKLSIAIDGMRAVYKNIGESDTHIGHYPFSPLHDIRLLMNHDFNEGRTLTAEDKVARMRQIDGLWRVFRTAFLSELSPPEPDQAVIERLRTDERDRGYDRRVARQRSSPYPAELSPDDLEIPKPAQPPPKAEF